MWESRLIVQSYEVQKTILTGAAFKYIPSTYLICENDNSALKRYQEFFAARAESKVESCSAGHSAMFTQTNFLANSIREAIQRAVREKIYRYS